MRIDHVALLVADLERAARFYEDVLGLARTARPALGFDGVWYALGQGQALHLMRLDDPCQGCARPAHGGRDRHVALAVCDLASLRARLEAAGCAYTTSRSGRRALFCRDPDGNVLELVER